MNAKVEWLVKAILVCLLFIQLSVNLPKITIKKTFVGILAALILIYLSHILLTITKKYSIEVPDMRGYITTFFSFFGVALLLALLCNLFYTFASRNKIAKITYMSVVVIYLFTCSIQTSYSNYYTAQNMAQSKLAFDVVNTFLSWEKFNQISDNSILYAEDLWKTSTTQIDLFGQGFNWEAYIYNKKKKLLHTAANITTYNELAKQDTSAPIYFIGKQEAHKTKEAVLLFAPIDRSKTLNNKITPIVNNVTIFYYSAYKEFSVTFSMKNPLLKEKKLLIGSYLDSTKENHFSFNVNCLEKNNASSIIELSAPNIDLNSIVISNMLLSNSPTIEIR